MIQFTDNLLKAIPVDQANVVVNIDTSAKFNPIERIDEFPSRLYVRCTLLRTNIITKKDDWIISGEAVLESILGSAHVTGTDSKFTAVQKGYVSSSSNDPLDKMVAGITSQLAYTDCKYETTDGALYLSERLIQMIKTRTVQFDSVSSSDCLYLFQLGFRVQFTTAAVLCEIDVASLVQVKDVSMFQLRTFLEARQNCAFAANLYDLSSYCSII